MKKRTFLSLALVHLIVFSGLGGEIIKTWDIGVPETNRKGGFDIITLEHALVTGKSGEPSLPYFAVKFLLPPGETAISAEFLGEEETILPGKYNIYPHQPSRPLSSEGTGEFMQNMQVYQSGSFYPENQTGKLITHYLNGYSVAMTTFSPLKFNPSTGEVRLYRKVTIKVISEATSEGLSGLNNLKPTDAITGKISGLVDNPAMLLQYPNMMNKSSGYRLLIITPGSFTNSFQTLTDTYTRRGITSSIVSTESIYSTMNGQDNQEKIRNYILQEYQNNSIEFVLLGGDIELVPYRGFYCYVQSGSGYEDGGIPADLYYSALDGNWNTDGDDRWGEPGEDDLLPEIAVGRFSFSTGDELTNMIHKTIFYQDYPVTGEFTKTTFAGEWLYSSPETWGSDYLELLIGYRNDNGYETWGIPADYNFYKLYEELQSWTSSDLMAEINAGRQYIHHVGHANATYVAYMSNSAITNSNFNGANGINHNYTIFHTHGCICGSFDYNDCILEKMTSIENFAVAVIGNSRYGWFNEGQTEGPAAHLHREMMDALYHEKINQIGSALSESKIQTAPWVTAPGQWEEGALRWNFYDINILGDPALSLWTDEPVTITATYPDTFPVGSNSMTVSVSSGGIPMENFTCVVMRDGINYGTGFTNALGTAIVSIDPVFTTTGTAELVISGYNCLPVSFPINIISATGSWITYSSHLINDPAGNANGQADYGETITLDTELHNAGSQTCFNTVASLISTDPFVTIMDNFESYGDITGQSSVTVSDAYELTFDPAVADQHIVQFEIDISGNNKENWTSFFSITVNAPAISIDSFTVDDFPGGNGNGIPDPDETIILNFLITNSGHSLTPVTLATLSLSNPDVTVITGSDNLGLIGVGNSATASFTAYIHPDAAPGSILTINLLVTAGSYTANGTYQEIISKTPVLIIDLDDNHSSGPAMLTSIQNVGLGVDYTSSFPAQADSYGSLFVCLGIYPDNHVLTTSQGQFLSNFLMAGGKIYMEGGDTWYYDPQTSVHSMFNINAISDGSDDMNTLTGQAGTFTEGITFAYAGENNWMDRINPVVPAFMIFRNQSPDYGAAVAYDAGNHSTIGTCFEFGGLNNGSTPSTKDELMFRYLDFFGLIPPPPPPRVNLTVILEGPFNGINMNHDLDQCNMIPLTQPFNTYPWFYDGNESVSSIPDSTIVDWVLIEFRETAGTVATATSITTVNKQAGFLKASGAVVGLDGNSLILPVQIQDNLYALICHRNHLPVLSQNPLILSGNTYSYNFTAGPDQVYGGFQAHKQVAAGLWGMIAGDCDGNGIVSENEINLMWDSEAGNKGYHSADLNLDGQTCNRDKNDYWLPNLGSEAILPD